ncbi:tyrosine--tRNA ligase [Clostridium bornimense]|uniref:tyrosine--tRNA ligase n=1 Tax=Clostridium bornimense TaxID=1216932 RepID=UPI001C0F6699|nr:tyrosine--tRNA ligase [Clostridium bornimense]MBU5316706.1 tyrosine--tRNA ligase [Clostridium bornimense]
MINIDEEIKIILKGVDEVINADALKEKIRKSKEKNKPLIVKLGLDPSAPDIHLGHTVVLRKMKQLQDLGHKVVIVIGDFTGRIGDPTGKAKGRKALSKEEVLENAKTYEKQIFKVLDKDKTEIRFNSSWLSKLNFEDIIKLASTITVARMLEREDFKKRYEKGIPISIHEFFYPLMQGYDSLELDADIEVGGTDQRFNVLMGRMLQKEYGKEPQVTLFMPLLEGLDGKNKMSKSLGNYIGIDEEPNVIYEKTMQLPDNTIIKYFNLVTDVHPDKIYEFKKALDNGEVNPRDIKMRLSKEIVRLYYGEEEAERAENRFKLVFQKGAIPDDIETFLLSDNSDIISLLVSKDIVKSKNEFRRLLNQGAIKINGIKVKSIDDISFEEDIVIEIGKKRFIKIKRK